MSALVNRAYVRTFQTATRSRTTACLRSSFTPAAYKCLLESRAPSPERQRQREYGAPAVGPTAGLDLAAVCCRDVRHEREAQAVVPAARVRLAGTGEALEHPRQDVVVDP